MSSDLRKLWMVFAAHYNEPMTKERLESFVELMAEFPPHEVEKAMKAFMRNPEISRMPLPAKVMQEIRPTLSVADASQQLLLRCQQAVGAYGFYQATKAEEFLGPVCWRAIGGQWGWEEFCMTQHSQVGTARAQLRERIKSLLASEARGERIEQLPAGGRLAQLNSGIGNHLAMIGEHSRMTHDDEQNRIDELTKQLASLRANLSLKKESE